MIMSDPDRRRAIRALAASVAAGASARRLRSTPDPPCLTQSVAPRFALAPLG
jgi:hypothetical protein